MTMVGAEGLEPPTLGLEIRCSIRLSYAPAPGTHCDCSIRFRLLKRLHFPPTPTCAQKEHIASQTAYHTRTLRDAALEGKTSEKGWIGHMSEKFPVVYCARHGETAWTLTGQHTGRTDLPLTERGEENARRLGERLQGMSFAGTHQSLASRPADMRTGRLRACGCDRS